ncbi:hypothetical protein FVQ98_13245 [Ottowia sp. GY511]|nr:hypothetical protein FVQ98_13245 [Ottowia sp. GY511]
MATQVAQMNISGTSTVAVALPPFERGPDHGLTDALDRCLTNGQHGPPPNAFGFGPKLGGPPTAPDAQTVPTTTDGL